MRMSPILFNLYLAEIDEKMEERDIGDVGIGRTRIWSLVYMDNIVLVANNREMMSAGHDEYVFWQKKNWSYVQIRQKC